MKPNRRMFLVVAACLTGGIVSLVTTGKFLAYGKIRSIIVSPG